MKNPLSIIILLLFCLSCSQKAAKSPHNWQEISGRDSSQERLIIRHPIYRAQVPGTWKRVDPSPTSSIVDTTLPLVEFWIDEEIHLTIHNFPSEKLEQRIPPIAQISRWQSQLKNLPPKEALVKPVSRGGFAGYFFEGMTPEKWVMGWGLQLDQEHYRSLTKKMNASNRAFVEQMRSDVTIKIVGPPHLCGKHRDELLAFANSFELIQEIPRSP